MVSSSAGTISDSTISGLSCGTSYTITVTSTDNAGNTVSESQSMSTSPCGGGGISTVSQPSKVHSWTEVLPGEASIMKGFDDEVGVKQITINVNSPAQNVKVTVTKHNEKPTEVAIAKTGKVYQYLEINAENVENKLDNANVEFRVEKSWVSQNNLNKDEIAVFRFGNNIWDELSTVFVEEDDDYYYYSVELDNFSYFVISEKSIVEEELETTQEIASEIDETEKEKVGLTWLWIIIAIVTILILLGIGYNKLKK